jgi:hypothetical protein
MDAHRSEYLAAIDALSELDPPRKFSPSKPVLRHGRIVDTWSAGDWISFTDDQGNRRAGFVIECLDDDGYGVYHVRSHRVGGGQDDMSVDGFAIHIF